MDTENLVVSGGGGDECRGSGSRALPAVKWINEQVPGGWGLGIAAILEGPQDSGSGMFSWQEKKNYSFLWWQRKALGVGPGNYFQISEVLLHKRHQTSSTSEGVWVEVKNKQIHLII